MSSPGQVFSDNLMRGFGLMDSYYARQDQRKMRKRADDRAAESHDVNMDIKGLQLGQLKRQDYASQYASIVSDDKGQLVDITKLSPEQMQQKKGQLVQFLNGYDPFLKDLQAGNPNVSGINDIQIIMDKKTGRPMVAANLKMQDGSVKPLTSNRSADPNDPVRMVPLADVHNGIMGYLGQDMGAKPTLKEGRENKAAAAKGALDHQRAIELENIKSGNKGSMSPKDVRNKVYSLNDSNYGSAGLNGAFSFDDDKGHKRNMANVVADHMINSGAGTDPGTISARSIQTVDQIYANGGSIKNVDGQWLMYTGQTDESGQPVIMPLVSDAKPDPTGSQPAAGTEKPADKQPEKIGRPPKDFAEYAEKVRAANPNIKLTDEELRTKYDQRYRGSRLTPGESKDAKPAKTDAPGLGNGKKSPAENDNDWSGKAGTQKLLEGKARREQQSAENDKLISDVVDRIKNGADVSEEEAKKALDSFSKMNLFDERRGVIRKYLYPRSYGKKDDKSENRGTVSRTKPPEKGLEAVGDRKPQTRNKLPPDEVKRLKSITMSDTATHREKVEATRKLKLHYGDVDSA